MTPKALRALLPVLRELRDVGVAKFATGEGESRQEFEFAKAEPVSVNGHLEPDADLSAEDDEQEGDPRYFLEKFAREGGYKKANGS